MLLRLHNGTTQAVDMREVAPMKASENMYAGNAAVKASGSLSIAVPGELAGLHQVWKQYGRLPWKRLVMPAEELAGKGFKVSRYLHMQMLKTESGIMADEGLRNIFTSKGTLLQPGQICRNLNLAKTLKEISEYGIETFYNGSIGLNLVRDVQNAGGILAMEDLQRYQVKYREPITADVLGLKILSMPPPSSGGAAMILILNILSQYGFPSGVSGSLRVHREIEALKHAFAVRMNLGDPDFVNVKNVVLHMLSPKFAEELKKTIYDNMTFDPSYYGGKWNQIHDHGTSHISIVDSERNAVSMTSTVNSYFGAQFLSPSTGITLNNEMDDFSIPANSSSEDLSPALANFIRPFKRPLSSMTPTIILKGGHLKAVVGASGGSMIIAGTTEVLLNHFTRKMDPLSSVLAPRYYHELIPNVLHYENWTTPNGDHFEVPVQTRAALQEKGHVLEALAGGTICQFIVQKLEVSSKLGKLVAVSDPRKGGFPAGF
ncbi:glutathione hydrolase 1-like isoform X2 [Diospyros lotus]|nr:glutathione hydrolase 1-like isoform X2 [Diospyros lotus]XP_052198039.1 glutathione hydrolase 1-like isoform X2 [Diospyros lotus]XP_052198040.1 glutathione hydrolase 1-like isoform X2 [Diospyros lotus]